MENFTNIFESRGFVNNSDDWRGICKYISLIISTKFPKLFKADNNGWLVLEILEPKRIFPDWINKITLKVSNSKFNHFAVGGIAAIDDDGIIINGNKCDIVISFKGDKLSQLKRSDLDYILNHEMQHAYLAFKSKSSITDKKGYKISVDGGPDEGEYTYVDIYKDKIVNGVSICDLFKEFTYACHEVETSASGREFNLFINNWFKTHNILTWGDLVDIKNIYKSGVLPLIILKCFDIVYDNINSLSDDDLDMILYNVKLAKYDKIVANYNIPRDYSKNLKSEFKTLLDRTMGNYGKKLIFKYRRFIEDAILNNPSIDRNSINILKFNYIKF